MTDEIIDSRGDFWSAGIIVQKGHFAPEESVSGRLRLQKNGRADLDATIDLGGSQDAIRRLFSPQVVEGTICGFLIDANKHVRLTGLHGRTSLGGMGPIRERLVANECLVSLEPFKPGAEPRFRWLDLPLDGYEEWLGQGHITVSRSRGRITADYGVQGKPMRWQAGEMSLEFHRGLQGNLGQEVTEVSWRERAFLRLGFPKGDLTVEEAITCAERIEDLLIILADCDKSLEFGRLRHSKSARPIQLYYARGGRANAEKVRRHKAWVLFDACDDLFGDIVASWFAKYATYGPGFHLYLGNRRGQSMYPEHRFASLIVGLEALHRSMYPAESNAELAAKVERILTQIDLKQIEKKKDRNWAERILRETLNIR